jgi:beta-mannosidase
MARDYNIPQNFENYVYVSQLLQARGMKLAIESHRRAMPYCMGTLYWQFNDCWPVTSWSSIDYYGQWKAAHYQVKRSYEPLLISFENVNDQINVFLINDLLKNKKGKLIINILDFQGETKWTENLNLNIEANSSKNVMTILNKDIKKWSNANHYLKVSFENEMNIIYNIYHFEKPKKMNLLKANLTWKIIDNKTIEIQTNTFTKDVYLSAENVKFENNFFDLEPYQKLLINFEGNFKDLKIMCLNNIY